MIEAEAQTASNRSARAGVKAQGGRSGGSGALGALRRLMWATGAVAGFLLVVTWAYNLGARDPAEIPALSFAESYYRQPAEAGGAQTAHQEAALGERFDPAASAEAASDAADLEITYRVERPTAQDMAVAAERLERGDMIALVADAANGDAVAMRDQLLARETLTLRTGDVAEPPSDRPSAPPNVGAGLEVLGQAEPEPQVAPERTAALDPTGLQGRAPPQGATATGRPASGRAGGAPQAAAPDAQTAPLEPGPQVDAGAPTAPDPQLGQNQTEQTQPQVARPDPNADQTGAAVADPDRARPSLPPRIRPTRTAQPSVPEPTQAGAAAAQTPLPSGAYLVQLAALDSVFEVQRRWTSLQSALPELLGPHQLFIEPVRVDGRQLYRLRAGVLPSRAEARRLCAALQAYNVACYVVRT